MCQSRHRRPPSADELTSLERSTEAAQLYRRLAGSDRAVLYRIATDTVFRAAELGSLTPFNFHLDDDPPAVTFQAAYSRRRRDDRQPIRRDLAEFLRPWLASQPVCESVFPMPDKLPPMLHADMRRTRARWIRSTIDRSERRTCRHSDLLTVQDATGRVVDFRAQQSTYITPVERGGASVNVARS